MDTYEKKYNEALEAARKELGVDRKEWEVVQQVLHNIFPELRESEDERIINLIRSLLENARAVQSNTALYKEYDDALAWLEKQEELFESGKGLYYYDGEKFTYCGYPAMEEIHYEFDISQQEKKQKEQSLRDYIDDFPYSDQKEQRPAEWSEKHIVDIFEKVGLAKIVREQGNDALTNAVQSAMIELSKIGKAEWSEEDADILNCCISSIEEAKENRYAYKETDGDTSYDHEISWLKSLRPQPKVEFSEDDQKTLDEVSHILIGLNYKQIAKDYKQAVEKLLYSRPSWRPSEEQMKALQNAVALTACDKELARLYNQLKKLI